MKPLSRKIKSLCQSCFKFALVWQTTALLFFLVSIGQPQTLPQERQLIIEKIDIIGNDKTKEDVIYRYLTIRPGDPIDPEVIEKNDILLSQTNFFKDVDFFTRPGSEKGKVILFIEIEERSGPYFQFGGGRSDLDGWYFIPISMRLDNFFGHGSNFGLSLQLGDRVGTLSLRYRNEHIIRNSAFVDAQLFGGGINFVHHFNGEKATHDVDFGGFKAKLGGTRGLLKHLFVEVGQQRFDPSNTLKAEDGSIIPLAQLPFDITSDLGDTTVAALSLGLYADTRDNAAYPLRGFWGALTGKFASDEFLDGQVRFSKYTLDARFYQKLAGRSVFAFHVNSGYATSDTPFYERFYLGGANSLRGYADRRLTPTGWGTKLLRTNTEIRFPLSKKNFPHHKSTGVIFFDAGGIWLPGQDPSIDDFYTALGLGFRIKLPVVGVTRFDFSFPLRNVDDNDFKFQLSLGQTF